MKFPTHRSFAPPVAAAALLAASTIALFALAAHAQETPPPIPPPPTGAPAPAGATDVMGAIWAAAAPSNFQPAARPADRPIDVVVIHDIEGYAEGAVSWFQNPQSRVSSHYVVGGPDGRTVWQQVRERDIAWHAGNRDINARSIGIEHAGYAYRPGFYNAALYEASAKLVREITTRYRIPRDRAHIIGHFEVPNAGRPGFFGGAGGHTDPGPYWDWDYHMTLIRNDATVGTVAPAASLVLHPGEKADITFNFTNTGDDPWVKPGGESDRMAREQGPVYLGVAGNNLSSLFASTWVSPRYMASVGSDTLPGASTSFTVSLPGPRTLGVHTETFRLIKVPPAPRLPVPFGASVALSVRVEPWELIKTASDAEFTAPGWAAKSLPTGKVHWRKPGNAATAPAAAEWKATLPIDGQWEVQVRVPAGKGRVSRAVYEVQATDGVKRLSLDLRVKGGTWRRLGRFAFTGKVPTAAVRLLATGNPSSGVLVADAVRFVGPFPAEVKPDAAR